MSFSEDSADPTRYYGEGLINKTYQKQGHIFCGCFCDTRRATIIVNVFNLIAYLTLMGLVCFYDEPLIESFNEYIHEEDLQNDFELLMVEYYWAAFVVIGVFMLFALLGVFGAAMFNKGLVVTSGFFYLLIGLMSLVLYGIAGLGLLWGVFFAYPHFVLYQEIGEKIMTPSNYANEVHSCCCVFSERRKLTIKQAIEKRVGVFA